MLNIFELNFSSKKFSTKNLVLEFSTKIVVKLIYVLKFNAKNILLIKMLHFLGVLTRFCIEQI